MSSPSLTNAERQQIYAQAWRDGRMDTEAWGGMGELIQRAKNRALRRYPDPKEPTVVQAEDGYRYRMNGRRVEFSPKDSTYWYPFRLSMSDVFALFEIAQEAQQEMGNA